MKLLVQHLGTKLFLADDGGWVSLTGRPRAFAHPVTAIKFCIARSLRDVRLVGGILPPGKAAYYYPFGNDPAIKKQKKEIRKFIAEQRRIMSQTRVLKARMTSIAYAQNHACTSAAERSVG